MILTTRNTHSPRRAHATPGRLLAAALVLTLGSAPELLAQASAAIQASGPLMLHINILEGEEALNNIRERTAREPIIQVEDQNHKPVAGAVILFTSVRGPNGAGGTFNSFTQYRTVTNAEGKAVGRGFQPNTTAGQFTIQVTATVAGTVAAATAVIHETNSLAAAAGSSSSLGASQAGTAATSQTATNVGTAAGSKGGLFHIFNAIPKWAVVGVVTTAAAAAAVAVVVTQNSNGTTISTGTGTVGAPSATPATARR